MQVRLLVGALKCVGTGEMTVTDGMSLSLSLSPCRVYSYEFDKKAPLGLSMDLFQLNGS